MANQLKMAVVNAILTLRQRGWSQRRIARELGIDRETVAKYVNFWEAGPKPATNAPIGSVGQNHQKSDPESRCSKLPDQIRHKQFISIPMDGIALRFPGVHYIWLIVCPQDITFDEIDSLQIFQYKPDDLASDFAKKLQPSNGDCETYNYILHLMITYQIARTKIHHYLSFRDFHKTPVAEKEPAEWAFNEIERFSLNDSLLYVFLGKMRYPYANSDKY